MKFTYKGKYVFFILTSILIISVLLSILSVNNKNKTILIGNYYNCSEKINTTFTSSFMDSNYLYKILYNNVSKKDGKNTTSINSLIKKADRIIVNIGNYELQNLIQYDQNKSLRYDIDLLNRQKMILFNNIENIIIHIQNINKKIEINIIDISVLTETYDNIIDQLNISINTAILSLSMQYEFNIITHISY